MAKNVVQDIVPPEKRSIRNVPVPNRATRSSSTISDVRPAATAPRPIRRVSEQEVPIEMREWEKEPPRDFGNFEDDNTSDSPFKSKMGIWIASGIAVLIVILSFMSLFSGATITVTAKTEATSTTQSFTAKKDAQGMALDFQIIKINKELGKTVPANGQEKVERKASGQITIFNNFSTTEQRLIKNTRFQTPEGLVFRINESVVVPGKPDANTPGSITVTVYADEVGDKYNIGLKDFTIPGFKGDPKYKDIYARSKTDMKDGFVGMVKKVAVSDMNDVSKNIDETLTSTLKTEITSQVPADFVLYPDAMFFTFESLPQTDGGASSVTLNRRGTLTGVMLNRTKLAEYLASGLVQKIPKTGVAIQNIDSLAVTLTNKQTFNPDSDAAVNFTISNPIQFISVLDTDKLKTDLLGKARSSFTAVLQNYPGILYGKETVRPFWKRSFPTKAKDVTITIQSDKL